MNKVLHKSEHFMLTEKKHRKSLKVYYELKLNGFTSQPFDEQVRDIVDPKRNRSGRFGTHWKYRNRVEAEKHLAFLLLKFL